MGVSRGWGIVVRDKARTSAYVSSLDIADSRCETNRGFHACKCCEIFGAGNCAIDQHRASKY